MLDYRVEYASPRADDDDDDGVVNRRHARKNPFFPLALERTWLAP